MNRRNFLRGIVIAGASFNILPGAGRIWKAQRSELVVNPAWVKAPYEIEFYCGEDLAYGSDTVIMHAIKFGPPPVIRRIL